MTAPVYQPSVSRATMQKAERLAEMIPTFHTGRDKKTGIRFYLVPGTEPMVAHRTTALYCSCLGFERNSTCSHQIAVSLRDQRQTAARIAQAQEQRRQNGPCKMAGCLFTAARPGGRCDQHNAVLCDRLGI